MASGKKVDSFETLAQRVAYARDRRGLSQTELAEKVGLKQPDISKLEKGIMRKTTAMASLVTVLRVPHQWLEFGEGPEPDWQLPRKELTDQAYDAGTMFDEVRDSKKRAEL